MHTCKVIFSSILVILISSKCNSQTPANDNKVEIKAKKVAILKEHLQEGAWKHFMFSHEWQDNIDAGLKKDSTIAYLWQQKAMPLFKQRKYQLGMPFIDKAVKYDAANWQPYRAFIKCIFAKDYKAAIEDFEDCKIKYGNAYIMDHTFDFYMALCYLQLNEFEKARQLLKQNLDELFAKYGETGVHHVVLFYYGIALYELDKTEEAISAFDRALANYKNFPDVKFYKGVCLIKQGKEKEGNALMDEGQADFKKGYTINEDNSIYEKYPYEVIWQ